MSVLLAVLLALSAVLLVWALGRRRRLVLILAALLGLVSMALAARVDASPLSTLGYYLGSETYDFSGVSSSGGTTIRNASFTNTSGGYLVGWVGTFGGVGVNGVALDETLEGSYWLGWYNASQHTAGLKCRVSTAHGGSAADICASLASGSTAIVGTVNAVAGETVTDVWVATNTSGGTETVTVTGLRYIYYGEMSTATPTVTYTPTVTNTPTLTPIPYSAVYPSWCPIDAAEGGTYDPAWMRDCGCVYGRSNVAMLTVVAKDTQAAATSTALRSTQTAQASITPSVTPTAGTGTVYPTSTVAASPTMTKTPWYTPTVDPFGGSNSADWGATATAYSLLALTPTAAAGSTLTPLDVLVNRCIAGAPVLPALVDAGLPVVAEEEECSTWIGGLSYNDVVIVPEIERCVTWVYLPDVSIAGRTLRVSQLLAIAGLMGFLIVYLRRL